jgi:predicted acyltransferase (DUF342 family)
VTTNFPTQIDSFSIKQPQQIIESAHINDITEAMVAVQVFAKSLEESLNNHLLQVSATHSATSISLDNIIGVDSTNVQTALQDLKIQLDDAIALILSSTSANLTAHISDDIATAHPNGLFPISRLDTVVATQAALLAHTSLDTLAAHGIIDYSILGSKITLGTITQAHLSFDLATQVELDTHVATNIATAHPNGNLPGTRIDDASIPLNKLVVDIATQAELDAHASTSTNVHGVGLSSQVVGTKTTQTLEGKTILSDFQGSKIILWTQQVTDEEKQYFQTTSPSADQFEIRQRAIEIESASSDLGLQIEGYYAHTVTVADTSTFSNIVGDAYQLSLYDTVGLTSYTATVGHIPSSTTLNIWSLVDLSIVFAGTSNLLVINEKNAVPLFSISPTGSVSTKELHVLDSAFNDIEFDDDVTIQGNLTVTDETYLQDNTFITGSLSVSGLISTTSPISTSSSVTASSLSIGGPSNITGSVSIGNSLTVTQDLTLGDTLDVAGNFLLDGYANIGQDLGISGGISVANFASFGNSMSIGGELDVAQDVVLLQDLVVVGDITNQGSLTVDGYTTINDNMLLNGVLTTTSDAYLNQDVYISGDLFVTGSVDLAPGTATINNNQVAPANVSGLSFDPSTTRGVVIDYSIYRYHTSPTTEVASTGTIRLIYKDVAATWAIDETYVGDIVGVTFTITPAGQIQYTSTNLGGTLNTSIMKYRYSRLTK